jgi:hypothetical protein
VEDDGQGDEDEVELDAHEDAAADRGGGRRRR